MPTNNTLVSEEAQAVIDALGDSGKRVVDFVHVTIADKLKANAEELRAMTNNYNEYVESAEAKQGDYITLLTSMRDALNVALGKHTVVATALNDSKQVSPAEVKEATDATAAAHLLESDWLDWRKLVDQRLDALERKDKVPTLAPVPVAEPAPEPKIIPKIIVEPEHERKAVVVEPNRPDQTVVAPPAQPVAVRYINPKTWGGLAWALAIIGAIICGIVALVIQGSFFPGTPEQLQWIRWATLWLFPLFGLFAGGALGSYIESRQQPVREAVVT